MGYKIQYDSNSLKKYPKVYNKTVNRKRIWITALIILLIIGIVPLYRSGLLKELLIPGDVAITEAAAEMLAENLKGGMPVEEAIRVFCREIIANGPVY